MSSTVTESQRFCLDVHNVRCGPLRHLRGTRHFGLPVILLGCGAGRHRRCRSAAYIGHHGDLFRNHPGARRAKIVRAGPDELPGHDRQGHGSWTFLHPQTTPSAGDRRDVLLASLEDRPETRRSDASYCRVPAHRSAHGQQLRAGNCSFLLGCGHREVAGLRSSGTHRRPGVQYPPADVQYGLEWAGIRRLLDHCRALPVCCVRRRFGTAGCRSRPQVPHWLSQRASIMRRRCLSAR